MSELVGTEVLVPELVDSPPEELPIHSPVKITSPAVLAKYSEPDLERLIENVQFQHAYPICGHCGLGRAGDLHVCCNKAGLNTKHEGVGRCQQHETEIFASSRAISPYTRHLREYSTLQEIFQEFDQRTSEMRELRQEISLARTVLSAQLQMLKRDRPGRNDELYKNILLYLEQIRRLVESVAKVEALQAQGITMEGINAFLWQVQRILDEEIVDPSLKVRIFDRIATEANFQQPTR